MSTPAAGRVTKTRVYLPLDGDRLLALTRDGEVGDAPLAAHAVTDSLRRALPGADEEELEYAALCDAVGASARLRSGAAGRRMVAAADVDPAWVTAVAVVGSDPVAAGSAAAGSAAAGSAAAGSAAAGSAAAGSAVWVAHAVPLRQMAAFHVDEAGAADDDELLWYDPTELGTF